MRCSVPSPSQSDPSTGQRLAQKTLDLCSISSVTGDEKEIGDWLENWLQQFPSFEYERVGHSFAVRGPWRNRPKIALVGHTDTVPPHPGDPAPKMTDTQVIGLGSSDMKGGLAIMMALIEDLDPDEVPYDLAYVFYDAEEGPFSQSGLGPLLDSVQWLKEIDLGFCLEPSDNVVQVGCVGTLHAKIEFQGKSCHSARPWQGENAIHKAGAFLETLHALDPNEVEVDGFVFHEVMSVTMAQGGRARNVIPNSFEISLNSRFAPGKSLERAQADVLERVGDLAKVEFTDLSPSGRVVTDNSLFQRFLTQTNVEVTAKQAWTDVARFTEADIDAVNFGPGLSSQAHQAAEYIDIDLLTESYTLFLDFLQGNH